MKVKSFDIKICSTKSTLELFHILILRTISKNSSPPTRFFQKFPPPRCDFAKKISSDPYGRVVKKTIFLQKHAALYTYTGRTLKSPLSIFAQRILLRFSNSRVVVNILNFSQRSRQNFIASAMHIENLIAGCKVGIYLIYILTKYKEN